MDVQVAGTHVVMSPDRNDLREAWGVCNPAAARSPDGRLYLFPRVVAAGNFSRIGVCRVQFDADGNPAGVQRLGMALEPETPYELIHGPNRGGVEDPRVTYIPSLRIYVMAYTALGPDGPRIALAISPDLVTWQRLGLVHFARESHLNLNEYVNKDGVLFPDPVVDPAGHLALAILHRPTARVSKDGELRDLYGVDAIHEHPAIWISYISLSSARLNPRKLTHLHGHTCLATPQEPWEGDRIGAGPPPILTDQGWLLFYHGVFRVQPASASDIATHTVYHGGAMLLDRWDPRRILWRTAKPVLHPSEAHGRYGQVPQVIFPTGVDARGADIDLYCGAADTRIAVTTVRIASQILQLPSAPGGLPTGEELSSPSQIA